MTAPHESAMPEASKPLGALSPSGNFENRLRLDGARAVIFGAGRGMGEATALALRSVGADVSCVDLEYAAAEAVAAKVGGSAYTCDVRSADSVRAVLAAVGSPLDVVVDVVGMPENLFLVDMTEDQWQAQFDVNLTHAFLITKYALPSLAANPRGARMVFISSVSGLVSSPYATAYGAAKAGLTSFVRSMASELGPVGVRINAVAPGATFSAQRERTAEERRHYTDVIPTGYINDATDIASIVLFLCSDLSRSMTGQTLAADGGASVVPPFPWGPHRTWKKTHS
jgi:NAD(P)-dependent dehydrogenase (short-subunit alcohol dehydrogenase family)